MYKVIWDVEVLKDLDVSHLAKIKNRVDNYLAKSPYDLGKALTGEYKGLYRYRYGDYRVIYEIIPEDQTIAIVKIGHRKNIY